MEQPLENASTTNAWPGPIFAITLFVEDLEAAKRFYQNVFGLPVEYQDAASAVFKFKNTLINLLKTTEAPGLINPAKVAKPEAGSRFVFTIQVDDVDRLSAELVSRGATLINGPLDRPWGIRTASFADPAGHIWEIARDL